MENTSTKTMTVKAKFTSFATYQDLVAFIKCLEVGNSSQHCYSKGDNGVGASGLTTAQIHTPMVALPRSAMISQFGSVKNAWAKKPHVKLKFRGKEVIAEVADIAPEGVCDLNPACLLAIGLKQDANIAEQGEWEWA